MRATTLWQPWATAVADGLKHHETRWWRPPAAIVGQRIAIHAGKRVASAADLEGSRIEHAMIERYGADWRQRIPRGAVVATAILGEPWRVGDPGAPTYADAFGDFSPGRWIWPLERVEAIEPVQERGYQGLWTWEHHAWSRPRRAE